MSRKLALFMGCMVLVAGHESIRADSCKVDLKLVNIGSVTKPQYKLGINVGIGGGAPMLYEFDTGGSGFWAAYNSALQGSDQWWGNYSQLGADDSMHITYTSGNEYMANLVATELAFYNQSSTGTDSPECSAGTNPIQISQIKTFQNPGKPKNVKQWNDALAKGNPPLEKFFYGDFGGALLPTLNAAGQGVYTALNQLKQNAYHNGFIVHVGPLDNAKDSSPYVQVGIEESDIESFPYLIPMNLACPSNGSQPDCPISSAFSNTPVNTYLEEQFNAAVTVSAKKQNSQLLSPMGVVVDSGAPHPTIWQYGEFAVNPAFLSKPKPAPGATSIYTGNLKNGSSVTIDTKTTLGTIFSTTESVRNKKPYVTIDAGYHQPNKPNAGVPYINTGIQFYADWDVMYDVTAGVIGLRPSKSNARYAYGNQTVTIPVLNVDSKGQFNNSPGINVAFMNGDQVGPSMPFTLDTGSTSVVVTPDIWTPPPSATPLGSGRMVYSSDGNILNGNWYQANIRLGTDQANAVASVPVLVVTSRTCEPNARDCTPSDNPTGTKMMGVGFAREATSQAVNWNNGVASVPENNPLLHITKINGHSVTASGASENGVTPTTLTSGYILTPKGLTIGLTRANTEDFALVKLPWVVNTSEIGWADWGTVPLELTLNGKSGSGYVLTDTGIQYMMVTPPPKSKYTVNNKCSGNGFESSECLVPGTKIRVVIGNKNVGIGADYAFKIKNESFGGTGGAGNPPGTPSFAIVNNTPELFVNTGYHFFNQYAYVYDYVNGYVGYRELTD